MTININGKIFLLATILSFSIVAFSCKNLNKNTGIVESDIKKDTLNTFEVENQIGNIKNTEIKNKKIYLDFYFGQPIESVILLQKKYIREGKIYMKKVEWDKTPHFFSNIPLQTTNVSTVKESKLKTDIKFNVKDGKLTSILLELFSERNFVPNELKKNQKNVSLKELEDNLTNESNSMDLDSELKKQKSKIENISFLYVNQIYLEIKELYKNKYGNPIYIKNELRIKNTINDNHFDKGDPFKLLWLVDGKYIEFNYLGLYSISLDYYNSKNNINNDDILIGSIFYNTIKAEQDSYKNNKTTNQFETNNKIDSSSIKARQRADKIGI